MADPATRKDPAAGDSRTYQSLAGQVAQRIAAEIAGRTWVDRLPGERILAETLQVSRKTVRKALAVLQHEGRIRTTHGVGHEIVNRPRTARGSRPELSIGLLTPQSLEHLRPFTALWVDAMRSLLIENGLRLTSFSGQRYFSRLPYRALERLVQQNPQACWMLAHSNERIQQWFQDKRVPCVIAGSTHHGLDLPNVDLDYFALCRHAVGAMLRHGHRRVAFLTRLSQRAGDLESEAGFSAGARMPSYDDVSPLIMRHDGTVDGVNRMLSRMFDLAHPPTAVLVANPAYYLTAVTFLAQRGLRVPDDVSLISRDDDTFLAYVNPTPARYTCSPLTFARRLLQPVLTQVKGEPSSRSTVHIETKYVAGLSLGAVPNRRQRTGGR